MSTFARSIRTCSLVVGLCLGMCPAKAGGPYRVTSPNIPADPVSVVIMGADTLRPPSRALAAAFALTLGPFGGHRLYLGTRPKVPLVYGLTFGGFGVLAVVDLMHILFTRDLAAYQESDRIFMWARSGKDAPTRP